MVYVRGAVLAVILKGKVSSFSCERFKSYTYAVNALAGVALVCVFAQILALGDVQGFGGDDLVEGVGSAGEELASVAMAKNMSVSNASIQLLYRKTTRCNKTYHKMCPCCS